MTHYETLGITSNCDFSALKKAYYAKAKLCHPDLFGNSPDKTEMFKRLVEAFHILSDPKLRTDYDIGLNLESAVKPGRSIFSETIMDTDYDDTLEELIVGNSPPEDATLMTLFLDLERTLVFMTWREARTYYAERKYNVSARLFLKLVALAPENILYRVYLARSFASQKEYSKAFHHYNAALNIGNRRSPPQNLLTVRTELERLQKRKNPFWHRLKKALFPPPERNWIASDEQMIQETSRAMQNILDAQNRKQLK